MISFDFGDGAFGGAQYAFGDEVVIPREFDFGVGFERFDDSEDFGGNFCFFLIVSDEHLEGGLFGVAVFAGFLIIEVFDDLEGGEFARMTTSIGATAGAAHATVVFDTDEFCDRGV